MDINTVQNLPALIQRSRGFESMQIRWSRELHQAYMEGGLGKKNIRFYGIVGPPSTSIHTTLPADTLVCFQLCRNPRVCANRCATAASYIMQILCVGNINSHFKRSTPRRRRPSSLSSSPEDFVVGVLQGSVQGIIIHRTFRFGEVVVVVSCVLYIVKKITGFLLTPK